MNAERQAEFLRAGVDRPITVTAERLVGARTDIDLHIASDLGAALDLGDRSFSVVLADQDRGLQPRFSGEPERQLPLVDAPPDRASKIAVFLPQDKTIHY